MGARGKKGMGRRRRERWCQSLVTPPGRHGRMAEQNERGITPAIEDYVKTIALAQQQEQKVNTNLVAARLDVSAASVTKVFQRLQQLELIEYTRYYGVTLTETGQQLAQAVLRRNRLVRMFLMKVLDFTFAEVQADADVLEHVISDALEQRIAAYLGVQYEEEYE